MRWQFIKFLFQIFSILTCLIFFLPNSHAKVCSSAPLFHQFLKQALPQSFKDPGFEPYHYILDNNLNKMMTSKKIDEALSFNKLSLLENLNTVTRSFEKQQLNKAPNLDRLLEKKKITLIIVPGIFGEFIKVRPFQEIFERTSTTNPYLAKIYDTTLDLESFKYVQKPLSDLIHISSIQNSNNKQLVKMVLLYTPFASLETLGDVEDRARIFNRRLQKYMNIYHDENIYLLGYSRGLTFALSMISQAQKENLAYLKNLRGVISYAGVAFGSSLADDTLTSGSDSQKLFDQIQEITNNLAKSKDNSIIEQTKARAYNTLQFSKLIKEIHPQDVLSLSEIKNQLQMNPRSALSLLWLLKEKLNLFALDDLNGKVDRFKFAMNSTILGVKQLRTPERTEWWKTHQIPTHIKYYNLSAAMANPNSNRIFDKNIFQANLGYDNSVDDHQLLKNQNQYVQLSQVELNDSQVSIAQSSLIPGIIKSLNPLQKDFKSDHLGVLGTHHWGITLRVVNEMNSGTTNPFPRKAILKALAGVLASDLENSNPCP